VFTDERVSRGLAIGDLDNDGRIDVVINDLDGTPQVLHNELPGTGNWLRVKLTGKGTNTNGIGALIVVKVGNVTLRRLVQSGTSYISQDDMRQHFGLGSATKVDSIEVRWPDATTSKHAGVDANQQIEIKQP
jgi:hypothetical protein